MVLQWAVLIVLLGSATANDTCQSKASLGKDYTGPVSKSKSGLECKIWKNARMYKSTGDHNMCRNPDNDSGGVWCFTKGQKDWEYCDVPKCDVAVDGGWSDWGDFGACNATCGPAMRKRERSCTSPVPRGGGTPCSGPSEEAEECALPECAVDGGWSVWGDFGACNATCGPSMRKRERSCTSPIPRGGGAPCSGPSEETEECALPECEPSLQEKLDKYCKDVGQNSHKNCKGNVYARYGTDTKGGQKMWRCYRSVKEDKTAEACIDKNSKNQIDAKQCEEPNPAGGKYCTLNWELRDIMYKNGIMGEDGFKDCTEHFKNRLASFEYSYYQGQWLYPYSYKHWFKTYYAIGKDSGKVSSTRTWRKVQWYLHDCGEGAVCAETKLWEKWYMVQKSYLEMAKDTNLRDGINGSNKNKHMAIWCQSCEPNPGTYTYNQCQLRFYPEIAAGNKYTVRGYTKPWGNPWRYRFGGTKSNSVPENYFNFRIESPPTREYWNVVFDKCNRNADNIEVTKTLKSSITTGSSKTSSTSYKLKLGLEAAYYVKAAVGFEAKKTYSETNMRKMSEEQEEKFNMQLPRGKRLIIKQLVAEAAYVTIRTQKFKTVMTDC